MKNEVEEDIILRKKFKFWIIICLALVFLCILVYLVENYIEKSYSLNLTIFDENCYNITDNNDTRIRCNLIEVPELRREIGNCDSYLNSSCVVEKDCGFNVTDYYTHCHYFAYEPIKKEDITLEFLENNCTKIKEVYRCYNRYIVEVN